MTKFFNKVKNYKLNELIQQYSDLARELFNSNRAAITMSINRREFGIIKNYKITITAWDLSDICYYSICNTNDFMYKSPNFNNILYLYNEYLTYTDELSNKKFESLPKNDFLLKLSVGLTQKQFWYQEISKIKEYFNRSVELLERIPKQIESKINPEDILENLTGFSIKTFRRLLFCLLSITKKRVILKQFGINSNIKDFDENLTEENIWKTIEYFTEDYDFFRKSPLKENSIFLKPIVRDTKNNYVVLNQFHLARKLHEGIYWLIRNRYQERNSQEFVDEYGRYYEKYIENLLSYYLSGVQFTRIRENKNEKRADWAIFTKKYQIFIEQKSSLMSLQLKKAYPNLNALDKYLENFKKAFIQLDNTSREYKKRNKTSLKFALHHDILYIAENPIKERVLELCKNELIEKDNYFLLETSELELLLQILKEDEKLFNKIIKKKLDLEKITDHRIGKEFSQVIRKFYNKENKYIEKVINHFDKYLVYDS